MADSVTHASFSIGRTLHAPVEKVYAAFADAAAKEKWFKGPAGVTSTHTMDFRVGGHESNSATFHDITHRFEATYYDIVPNERIIYAYEMYLNDTRISVSLATIELQDMGNSTQILLSEDGAYLDSGDTPDRRERGTNDLLNALEKSLD